MKSEDGMTETVRDLNDPRLRKACEAAVLEVLELMFFELPEDEAGLTGNCPADSEAACAGFDGSLQGRMTVALSGGCSGRLVASLLGVEEAEPDASEVQSTLAELTNMICGATMSRLEPEGRLRIEPPKPGFGGPAEGAVWLRFPLEAGSLAVTIRYEEER
jgi:CheY-specific phosphatase CheX